LGRVILFVGKIPYIFRFIHLSNELFCRVAFVYESHIYEKNYSSDSFRCYHNKSYFHSDFFESVSFWEDAVIVFAFLYVRTSVGKEGRYLSQDYFFFRVNFLSDLFFSVTNKKPSEEGFH